MSTEERPPAVAGMFYPGDGETLQAEARKLLERTPDPEDPLPKAIIAPHAAYQFSGGVAGRAYAPVASRADAIERVVLVGPSHFVPFRGFALPSAAYLRTPLGRVPVDARDCEDLPVRDDAHAREHSLEVQLPLLQELLGDFTVVPLAVGRAEPEEMGALLERLWGDERTLVVVSSDLSHYHDNATARRLDQATAEAIRALDHDTLGPDNACGFEPIRGLLWLSGQAGHRIATAELATSADAGAPPEKVVGYGAFLLEEAG